MRNQKRWADVLTGGKVCFGDQTQAIWTKEGMFAHFAGSSKYVDGSRRVYEPDADAAYLHQLDVDTTGCNNPYAPGEIEIPSDETF